MDKSQRIPEEIIDLLSGGTLYVSVDGGEKIEATVGDRNGEVYLYYMYKGSATSYNTGIKIDNPLGFAAHVGLTIAKMQPLISHTVNVDSSSKGFNEDNS